MLTGPGVPQPVNNNYLVFLAAFFLTAAFFAGLDLPNDPLKRLPLAVFLSPLPIKLIFTLIIESAS
jgi:hypothetical protein